MLDIFKDDAFSEIALTDAITKLPYVPGQAGSAVPWASTGVSKTTIAIEEVSGELRIINPSPRGSPGTAYDKQKRTLRNLSIPHYQINDGIYADEVQGVREFGQESGVKSLSAFVNARMAEHATNMDVTIEHQRLGAIKGIIVDGDGNTLYNLFTEFGVTPPTEVDWALDGSADNGHVRKTCAAVMRTMANHMGGVPWSGIGALCSPEFFDALIAEPEVRATYLGWQEARELRSGYAFQPFSFGGIRFEEYRGLIGGSALVTANKMHMFPLTTSPGVYRTVFAPADYNDTVNTIGLPRYARQRPFPNDKGIELELQTNSLSFVTRPGVLIQGKTT